MLSGELYDYADPELVGARLRARRLVRALNASSDDDPEERARIVAQLFGRVGVGFAIEPPFRCDYGSNIRIGDRVFINFNCVFLDTAPVEIGDHVQIGPSVQIYTVNHPLDATARRSTVEYGRPVRIGDDVWIGGGAIVLPGVSIGARSVIGAGSVVTRDVPEDALAAGNPCRVIRSLRG
jgi:maltose O-acetyltransferase